MTGDLELTVLHEASGDAGYVSAFAMTDQLLVLVGGTSNRNPTCLASSNARHFERRSTPKELGLRSVIAVGDALWACGEHGQLASSRDHGASWSLIETGTSGCLYSVALGLDGAVWVVGDDGYAARVLGEKLVRVDLGTSVRISRVVPIREEICFLCFDGKLRRWSDGAITEVSTGATKPLTGLVQTKGNGWVVTGDGGFIGRSPDGTWFSRVPSGVEVDLEGIAILADGRLIVVGDRGQVLLSTDEGRTWRAVPNDLGLVHLWSIKRFGGGVLIGGDDGLVVKLAPPGDATWSDRINAFGGAKPLDEAFAVGPEKFIERGLVAFLAAGEVDAEEGEDGDEDDEDDDDDDGDDDDDDDDEDDDDDDGDDDAEGDGEAFSVLAEAGDANDFEDIYGVPFPTEADRFFHAVDGQNPWSTFAELRLDNPLRPDVGEHNLFELMVRRNQAAYLGTDLVEAFSGVFGIGSQGNGDTYHMEIYPWDEQHPRQVLHFDHETHSFSGVFSDSLDSLVYLAAIVKAGEARTISQEMYDLGIRRLRGKCTPTWHFSIDDKDPEWVNYEPKRRDTEFFFYRSRWITSLLKNDGVTDVGDIPQMFMADFNQVIPEDQLPARYEACEKFIPTALYAMWRAFLFDEPELDKYLEISRRHAARLVRDAAKLIDRLRGGHNQLGTITDVKGWLAAFRALDLDPRRAAQRTAEAAAKASQEAARAEAVAAELARTPEPEWNDLAWKWLDDGVAHRALVQRLDVSAVVGLGELSDDERAVALPRVAQEMSPALEAVLVGSLLRNDNLSGALAKAPKPVPPDDDEGDVDEDDAGDSSPGWDAIDAALEPIYGNADPMHWGTVVPYSLGGNDPIHGISCYPRSEPTPHWHFITYGFTDLFSKETDDPEESGFGFELTFRLARATADEQPPPWALNFLQNLGRYVFSTGNRFAIGHKMGLNGPIALGHDTQITAICFADDPELGEITSEFGKAQFVQIVGITDDEYRLIQEWSTHGLIDILRKRLPLLVTDLARSSVLDDPEIAAEAELRVTAEGSSEDLTFAGELAFHVDDGRVRIELGALYAAVLPRAMRGRIRHGRPYTLRGRDATLHLRPGSQVGYSIEDDALVLEVTQGLAREMEAQLREALASTYDFEAWPALEIVVTPSFIRAQDGTAAEIKGIADPVRATQLLAEENARLAALPQVEDEEDEDEDDEEDDEDEGHAPAPRKVLAALAMTTRALLLAPDDSDVQFTHAMLLLDVDKIEDMIEVLPRFVPSVRVNVAVRVGKRGHARFGEIVDIALAEALPDKILSSQTTPAGGAAVMSFGDVAQELFGELADAIVEHVPERLAVLVPLLPDNVNLICEIAAKAIAAGLRDPAMALYDRVLALPIPGDGDDRMNYLRALNNACVQAHAAKAYEAAARIADRAQPVAHENPYIYHSAACAYAALGDYAKALDQVRLAIQHEYDHVGKVEVDHDLGQLLEWPEFKAMFRDWHARQEGN